MSELTGNTESEMLNLLLDGELTTSQEVPLYSALAGNDELRNEMRDMIAIRNSILRDDEAFTPPIAATAAIFQGAGFSKPIISGIAATGTGFWTGLLKYGVVPLVIAGTSALITWFLISGNSQNNIVQQPVEKSQSSSIHSGDVSNLNTNPIIKEKIVYKYVYRNKVNSDATKENSLSQVPEALQNLSDNYNDKSYDKSMINFSDLQRNISKLNSSNKLSGNIENNINKLDYDPLFKHIKSERGNSLLTIRGIAGLMFPAVNAQSNGNSFLTNAGVGLYFINPYKNLRIGFEVGNEPFSQSFINIENNKRYRYNQMPNTFWGGLSIWGNIDSPIDMLYNAKPFGKLLIGANEVGPMTKLMVGLDWTFESLGIGMFLGAEGSLLAYQNQSVWYYSQKLGLTYGMSIHF